MSWDSYDDEMKYMNEATQHCWREVQVEGGDNTEIFEKWKENADFSYCDKWKRTMLMFAARNGKIKCFKWLVRYSFNYDHMELIEQTDCEQANIMHYIGMVFFCFFMYGVIFDSIFVIGISETDNEEMLDLIIETGYIYI